MYKFNSIAEIGEFCQALGADYDGQSFTCSAEQCNGFSYQAAIESAIYGGAWPQGAQDLNALCISGDFAKPVMTRRVHAAESGFVPIIPNALMGLRDSLLTISRQPVQQRIIKIGVNVGRSWSFTDQQALCRGRAVLSLVNTLEALGYKTEIYALWVNKYSRHQAHIETLVKPINAAPNLSALAFCFCSFAFQRRLCWRIAEAHYPVIANNGNYGNGADFKGEGFDVYFPYATQVESWDYPPWALNKLQAILDKISLQVVAA